MRITTCVALLGLLGGLLGAPQAGVADTLRTWRSGDWQAGAYAANESKQFINCRASRAMDAKTNLILMYTRLNLWVLALTSSEPFRSAVGSDQSVALSIDQTSNWTVAARTISINVLEASLAASPPLVDALRRGRQLVLQTADGHHGAIGLDGTDRVMDELMQCTQSYLAAEKGTPGQGFAASQPAPATPAAPMANPALELAATRIASNLLLQAGLPNAHLLAPAETPPALKGLGAAWTSSAGSGSVTVLPNTAGRDASQVALAMIVGGANICKGEFAAGRTTTLVDDTLVTKSFTACNDSAGTRTVHFFVLHREGTWYVVYAVIPLMKPGTAGESPLSDAAFQTVAVKAALYQ